MRIAVVGSRGWTDEQAIKRYIDSLPTGSVIISGGASGVDSMAEKHARARGLEVVVFEADWSKGNDAGAKRNAVIVANSDVVVAFWDGKSKGTMITVDMALKAAHIQRVTVVKKAQEGQGNE